MWHALLGNLAIPHSDHSVLVSDRQSCPTQSIVTLQILLWDGMNAFRVN